MFELALTVHESLVDMLKYLRFALSNNVLDVTKSHLNDKTINNSQI